MYENYLLNAAAIASVMSNINGFRDSQITAEEISGLVEKNRWEEKYFIDKIRGEDRSEEFWIKRVHGAKMLEDLFKTLSEKRVNFNKVEHDLPLTKWIIANAPKELAEIGELIKKVLSRNVML